MAIVASLLFVTAAELPKKPAANTPFETVVTIAPSTHDSYMLLRRATPYTYTCQALVLAPKEPDKPQRALAAIKLVLEPGHSETQTKDGDGVLLRFSTKIDAHAERAEWTLSIERDGEVVSRQKSNVLLEHRSS